MKELLQKIEKRMDDFTVKKKLYILYIFCVLLPLIITDSVVFFNHKKFRDGKAET